jgi:hypothetical protein
MSNTITAVTAEQIIAEVRRLAAERPDYVYEKPEFSAYCLYMHGDGPGCIFGHALHNLGWDFSEEQKGTITSILLGDGPDPLVETTSQQRLWMRAVQSKQDNAFTWGKAVELADEEFPLG